MAPPSNSRRAQWSRSQRCRLEALQQSLETSRSALESYERALALDPAEPYIYCSQATVYNRTARPDRALASSREAIAVDPDHVGALFNMATALRQLGRDDEADAALERAFEMKPELRPNDGD